MATVRRIAGLVADCAAGWPAWTMWGAVGFEALMCVAAVLDSIFSPWPWVPNLILTLATFGLTVIACKVAADYRRRGLNDRQWEEVAEVVRSSGLTEQQQLDLVDMKLAAIVGAERAVVEACQLLGHGKVAVIRRLSYSRFCFKIVEPPSVYAKCGRNHYPQGGECYATFVRKITDALIGKSTQVVAWEFQWEDVRRGTDRRFVFNPHNCAPERQCPVVGDYVLDLGHPDGPWVDWEYVSWVQHNGVEDHHAA